MQVPTHKEMLDAGVHFGHLKRKWNPKMSPYIFSEKKGIHIIDLYKTKTCLEQAGAVAKNFAKGGKKIIFVATKKQAAAIVKAGAEEVGMPFVTERWLGGMMTNFATIRKSIRKMQSIERMLTDKSMTSITKKEKLTLTREKDKLEAVLGGMSKINRIPHAIFLVDIAHEHLALAESKKLGLTTFGIVDTNSNPNLVDHPIPGNDDASKSIELIMDYMVGCVKEGLAERASNKKETATA